MGDRSLSLRELVEEYGQLYSESLGIKLQARAKEEIAKWLLAAMLYAKPIRESTATKTFRCFEKHGVDTPARILKAGWDALVVILDEGGYTRYDHSTANKLLLVFRSVEAIYGGDLSLLHEQARDSSDLEDRLKALGKGIGDMTVSIFLRDLRGIWPKANPKPSALVQSTMARLGVADIVSFAAEQGCTGRDRAFQA